MSLTSPVYLWLLAIIPLLVLLHSMRTRKREVVAGSLMIWKLVGAVQKDRQSRRSMFSLDLLLLVSAALCAVLGATGPELRSRTSVRTLSLVLDCSASMSGEPHQKAVKFASELIASLSPYDSSVTLTAAGEVPQTLCSGTPPAQALEALGAAKVEATSADVAAAVALALRTMPGVTPTVLTDGPFRGSQETRTITFGKSLPNAGIVAAAAHPDSVFVSVANYSDSPFRGQLRLSADSTPAADFPLEIEAGGRADHDLPLASEPAGSYLLQLLGEDAFSADNSLRLRLRGRTEVRVAVRNNGEGHQDSALRNALSAIERTGGPRFRITDTPKGAASGDADLLLGIRCPVSDVDVPGLWFAPTEGPDLLQTREHLSGELTHASEPHKLLTESSGAPIPILSGEVSFARRYQAGGTWAPVLLCDGTPVAWSRGSAIVFAFTPDEENTRWVFDPSFVILVGELAKLASANAGGYTIDSMANPLSDQESDLRDRTGDISTPPGIEVNAVVSSIPVGNWLFALALLLLVMRLVVSRQEH